MDEFLQERTPKFSEQQQLPTIESSWLDAPASDSTDEVSTEDDRRPRHVSVVDSPFGPLALTVKDPSSYCSSFPVFADDAGEQDLQELLEHGLTMLDAVQVSLSYWTLICIVVLSLSF